MAEENVYENPANPRQAPTGGRGNPRHQVVDMGNEGEVYVNERAVDVAEGVQGARVNDSAIMRDVGSIDSQKSILSDKPSRQKLKRDALAEKKREKREKKFERERKKRGKKNFMEQLEMKFGKFTAKIGWRATLAFMVFIFSIAVVSCVFVVFVYLGGKVEKPDPEFVKAQQEKLRQENEAFKAMIDDVYQKITKQMNDMEDKFDGDMERVVSSINNKTEHVKDFMGDNEDHVVKAFNNTGDYVSEIVKKQEEQIEEQFEDQTAKIKHNSYEIHKETSKKLDVMGKDISALFKNQDASIDGHISNIREDMTGLFLAQENVLEGQLQYLEKSVLDGLSEKDANFSTALIEFQGDVENGLAHMKKSLINNVEDVSVKVINKIEDMEEGTLRNILSSEEQITRMVDEQDKRIMDLTGGAVFDITNQTTGTETKLIQHLESEGENSRTKISTKLLDISHEIKDTLDTSVKAVKAAESKIIVPSEVACSDIDKDRRIECGPQEITLEACEARKCCYDTTITKAIWCFKKETSHYEYFASKYKRFTDDVADHGSSLLKTLAGLPRSVENTISDLLEYDVPESCEEIRYHNGRSRGTYGAWYDMNLGRKLERAICSEKNLGWMVLMIFKDASSMVSHADRSFSDYVSGYGTTSENFWAGLENMHRWTSTGTFKLRIELNDFEVGTIVQTYKSFKVGDRNSGYKLSIGSFFAKESDTLITNGDFSSHDGAQFSAKDEGAWKSCAVQGGGGWWYKFAPSGTNHACYKVKLTGKRYADPTAKASKEDGITAGPTKILYTGAKMFIKRYYTDTV